MKLCISAVEHSGDRLGAALYTELKKKIKVEAYGICGPKMRAVGIQTIVPMETINAMGIAEALAKLPAILSARKKLINAFDRETTAIIAIDGPDFHLPILKHFECIRIGMVSPQIWAWRSERAQRIALSLDMLLCLFDFEPKLYPKDFDARFIGHPIVDWFHPAENQKPNLYGLAPGSRPQEIKRMWPIFLKTAMEIKEKKPSSRFIVSAPVNIPSKIDWITHSQTGSLPSEEQHSRAAPSPWNLRS